MPTVEEKRAARLRLLAIDKEIKAILMDLFGEYEDYD